MATIDGETKVGGLGRGSSADFVFVDGFEGVKRRHLVGFGAAVTFGGWWCERVDVCGKVVFGSKVSGAGLLERKHIGKIVTKFFSR